LENNGHTETEHAMDKADDDLLAKMQHLALNILLYTSQPPIVYTPDTVMPQLKAASTTSS
jgi:hypothetical protein